MVEWLAIGWIAPHCDCTQPYSDLRLQHQRHVPGPCLRVWSFLGVTSVVMVQQVLHHP